MTKTNRTALIMIDWQVGFDDWDYWGGNRNNPAAEENAKMLLDHWRTEDLPVIYVSHHSLNPESPLNMEKSGGQIIPLLAPREGEIQLAKRMNSGFIGTDLDGCLRRAKINDLVICGLTTNHCVSTTTRMAGNMGFDVQLAGDACATFDRTGLDGRVFDSQLIHDTSLTNLHEEFCIVRNSRDIIAPPDNLV
ncbi:cysteine hydrolase family protein [Aestuariispira insulae]|uniref:Nicotinamidase-related amidase n=1 Tax=Aestuariispira insulae TaxID=1461337 RepID=A0A3D9HXY7_9PROT|nr:cysteine hydrolase family protein [Aestuariispira insulae]RED54367.1 nicotinamidase-related amidase [Aestuariispira insulae]